MEILFGILIGLVVGVIAFAIKRSLDHKSAAGVEMAAISLDESYLNDLKSTIQKEVAQAALSSMTETNKATEQVFNDKTKLMDQQTKDLLQPAEQLLKALDEKVKSLTKSYDTHQGKVTRLTEEMQGMNTAANNMVAAMKSPVSRGKWGENQLINIIELAGMTSYSDFDEQASGETDVDGRRGRPDVIVRLPGKGKIAIDAKAPKFAEAYEKMLAAEDTDEQKRYLQDHIKAMRKHLSDLQSREYWNQFKDSSPEFVVMFVPLESMLADALRNDPSLVDDALRDRVLIASPMNLLALLLAAAKGWQDIQVHEKSREILELNKKLFQRMSTFSKHLNTARNGIVQASTNFDKMLGSYQSRVMPTLKELDSMELYAGEHTEPELVGGAIRELSETSETENSDS